MRAVFLSIAIAAVATPALADCPPVGRLPALQAAGAPVLKAKETRSFKLTTRAGDTAVSITGKSCTQHYTFPAGTQDVELQTAYRVRLQFQGAQLLYAKDHETTEIILQGTAETWIAIQSGGGKLDLTVLEKAP